MRGSSRHRASLDYSQQWTHEHTHKATRKKQEDQEKDNRKSTNTILSASAQIKLSRCFFSRILQSEFSKGGRDRAKQLPAACGADKGSRVGWRRRISNDCYSIV